MTRASDERSRDERALHAYYDGELSRLARWRFARRLARSEELRRELRMLEAVGASVRGSEAGIAAPDVWGAIAGRLAGVDAERAEAAWEARQRGGASWLWKPLTALAGAAAAVALAFGLFSRETAESGVVHWVDSGSHNVMVLDQQRDVTVIWVFDPLTEDAGRGGSRASA